MTLNKPYTRIAIVAIFTFCTASTSNAQDAIAVAGLAKTLVTEDARTVVSAPLNMSFGKNLAAIDIPLKYSEGVTLVDVKPGAALEGWEFTSFKIDEENHILLIGAIRAISKQPTTSEGQTGEVARLTFQLDNPSVETVTLQAIEQSFPDRSLSFVYYDFVGDEVAQQSMVAPIFSEVDLLLSSTETVLPSEFALGQNYPNPFNPSTKINLDLPQPSAWQITVFNVLGQEVRVFNGDNEAGRVTVEWDASEVSSGMYFYKVVAGNFAASKKMVLLK